MQMVSLQWFYIYICIKFMDINMVELADKIIHFFVIEKNA
jgi:hypothetical protein